jgi:hypothetical protein
LICYLEPHIDDSALILSTYGLNLERRILGKILYEVDNSGGLKAYGMTEE